MVHGFALPSGMQGQPIAFAWHVSPWPSPLSQQIFLKPVQASHGELPPLPPPPALPPDPAVPPLLEPAVPPLVDPAVPPLLEPAVPPPAVPEVPPPAVPAVPPLLDPALPPLVDPLTPAIAPEPPLLGVLPKLKSPYELVQCASPSEKLMMPTAVVMKARTREAIIHRHITAPGSGLMAAARIASRRRPNRG